MVPPVLPSYLSVSRIGSTEVPEMQAVLSRRSLKKRPSGQKKYLSISSAAVWIPCSSAALAICCVLVVVASAALAIDTSVDTEALDRRVDAVLRLFEASALASGEAELRDMADQYPSYARAPFYLGLLSQSRSEPEIAVGYYAAALSAGIAPCL